MLEVLGESVGYWSNVEGRQLTESSGEGSRLRRVRGEQDLRSLVRSEEAGISKEGLETGTAERMGQQAHGLSVVRSKVETCLEAGVEVVDGKTAGSGGAESETLCKVCGEGFQC